MTLGMLLWLLAFLACAFLSLSSFFFFLELFLLQSKLFFRWGGGVQVWWQCGGLVAQAQPPPQAQAQAPLQHKHTHHAPPLRHNYLFCHSLERSGLALLELLELLEHHHFQKKLGYLLHEIVERQSLSSLALVFTSFLSMDVRRLVYLLYRVVPASK